MMAAPDSLRFHADRCFTLPSQIRNHSRKPGNSRAKTIRLTICSAGRNTLYRNSIYLLSHVEVSKRVEVLLVEDNAGDILLMRQTLAREPFPISIHVAVDGKQAMQMAARQFDPDLVILDLNIPVLSGLSVLEFTQPEVPVVVFTSSSNPQDRQCSFDLGANDYVQKPTDLREFVQQVSQIVST